MKTNILLFLVIVASFSVVDCFAQQDRSIDQGTQLVKLAVKNNTRQNVVIAWVNFQGQMESYGSLQPGRS